MIRFRNLAPGGPSVEEIIPVSEIMRRDSLFLSYLTFDHDLPPLEETNRILLQGRGDDGHFILAWEPVELSKQEYQRIRKQLRREASKK